MVGWARLLPPGVTPGVAGSEPALDPRDRLEEALWESDGRIGVRDPGVFAAVEVGLEADPDAIDGCLDDDDDGPPGPAGCVCPGVRRSNGFRWSVALGVVWSSARFCPPKNLSMARGARRGRTTAARKARKGGAGGTEQPRNGKARQLAARAGGGAKSSSRGAARHTHSVRTRPD